MMYQTLLIAHSYWRWLVLISLLFMVVKSFVGYKKGDKYSNTDNLIRILVVSIAHIQLLLGLVIYTLSPFVSYFFNDVSSGLHLREVRFFAIEHSLMMVISVVLITIGSIKSKRKTNDVLKHKTVLIWFSIALVIILLNIPWEFSPLVNRPSFR